MESVLTFLDLCINIGGEIRKREKLFSCCHINCIGKWKHTTYVLKRPIQVKHFSEHLTVEKS